MCCGTMCKLLLHIPKELSIIDSPWVTLLGRPLGLWLFLLTLHHFVDCVCVCVGTETSERLKHLSAWPPPITALTGCQVFRKLLLSFLWEFESLCLSLEHCIITGPDCIRHTCIDFRSLRFSHNNMEPFLLSLDISRIGYYTGEWCHSASFKPS